MQTVDDKTFASEVTASKVPVIVKLGAQWCAPCRAMAPALEQAATTLTGMRVVEVDIDRSPATYMRLGSPSVPTTILFRGGREVARRTGAMSAPGILAWVASQLR